MSTIEELKPVVARLRAARHDEAASREALREAADALVRLDGHDLDWVEERARKAVTLEKAAHVEHERSWTCMMIEGWCFNEEHPLA